jgi:hypothetical protein
MGQKEKDVINREIVQGSTCGRLFRANCGLAWVGKVIKHTGSELILKNPRPFHGLPKGFSDLFGFEVVKITPELVGQEIAVFKAVEIKTGKLTLKKEQKLFIEMVEKNGGIAIVVRD